MKLEIIMTLGAEGGSINLVGIRTGSNWEFRIETSDEIWMLADDDAYIPPAYPWVATWAEALAELDRYPWAQLYPVHVHPEFRAAVAEDLQKKKSMGGRIKWSNWDLVLGSIA